MGQPTIIVSSGFGVAKFGNMPLPNGQGTLANINLNDGTYARLADLTTQDDNHQVGLSQLLYRSRSAYISDDFGPRTIALKMIYKEDATHFLGQFLAALSQAGEQQLTFDNATYILAKYHGATSRQTLRTKLPLRWSFLLTLIAKSPWFQDAAATTMAPLTLTVDAGQSFNITYAGSVWAEPVWTLVIPAGNGVPINSFQIRNTMSGEFLTVNFLSVGAIPASTARTVIIDCAAMTAIDNLGNNYDVTGSFPMLYPPVGTVNPFTVVVVPASGSSSGLTIACSHYPRWEI